MYIKLKQIREAKGLSQSKLAAASGVSIRVIQAYEQGAKDINKARVSTLLAIAKALHCNIEDLIDCN